MNLSPPDLVYPDRAYLVEDYSHGRVPRVLTAADGSLDVRGTVDLLLTCVPGPAVLTVASQLLALDPVEITDTDRVDLVYILERCESWLQATKQPVLAQLGRAAGRKTTTPGKYEDLGLELALRMHWSESMAQDRMGRAQLLTERLPATMAALAGGEIWLSQALAISNGARVLDHPDAADPVAAAAELERRVLPKASTWTWSQTDPTRCEPIRRRCFSPNGERTSRRRPWYFKAPSSHRR